MGLFDFFKGRRNSEDAMASARAGEEVAPEVIAAPITGADGEQIGAPVNPATEFSVPGLQNMGALGPLIQQAIDAGHAQVVQAPPQVMSVGGNPGEARQQILDVLAKHGIDAQPGSGQSIPVYDPNMMNEIFGVLGQHGLNPTQFQIPGAPGTPPTPPAPPES